MRRYWYTLRSGRGVWFSGWAFGETPAAAAQDALTRESRYHPVVLTQRPLKAHLQHVPDYTAPSDPNPYSTVEIP